MALPRDPPCAPSRAPFWLCVALWGLGGALGPTVGLPDCIFGLGRFVGASPDAARTISGSLLQCSGFYVEGSRIPGPLQVPGSRHHTEQEKLMTSDTGLWGRVIGLGSCHANRRYRVRGEAVSCGEL